MINVIINLDLNVIIAQVKHDLLGEEVNIIDCDPDPNPMSPEIHSKPTRDVEEVHSAPGVCL